jgi:hypothetical protein
LAGQRSGDVTIAVVIRLVRLNIPITDATRDSMPQAWRRHLNLDDQKVPAGWDMTCVRGIADRRSAKSGRRAGDER